MHISQYIQLTNIRFQQTVNNVNSRVYDLDDQ
jgi:hypothetical protein